jgi:hypothetical protein
MHSPRDPKRFVAVLVTAVLWLAAVAPVLAHDPVIGVLPQAVAGVLQPGGSLDVDKTIHTPEIPPKPDIYFLADSTGSMGSVITQVKLDAADILADIDSQTTDPRYGAGDYKDFPPEASPPNPYAFLNAAPIPAVDDDGASALAAIAAWAAAGGGDGSEGQFYALHLLAGHSVAAWRSDSTKIIVWFGDAPGHDPVCTAISGHPEDITEASVTSDLVSAGIRVVAISTLTGFAAGLDDDPTLFADDYAPYCAIDGTEGQATRIAEATGGVHLTGVPADDIADAILAGLSNLPVEVTPSVGACDPRLSLSFDPTTQTVQSGEDALFTETITVSPTALVGVATCQVDWLLDGQPAGPEFTQLIEITIVPGPPATLTLEPESDTNTVDAQHCVTATVRDAATNPTPGITVEFSVQGSVTTGGSAVTDANGQATFCYTGPALPGADLITATASGGTNPSDTASKTWVLPVSTEGCLVTYGGRITAANGDKATFGGNAMGTGPAGQEQYQDHGPAAVMNVHSIEVQAVTCSSDGTMASIFGTATIDGGGSYDFRIDLKDLNEPGTSDTYRIRLSNGYDSGEQVLDRGNVQIHF